MAFGLSGFRQILASKHPHYQARTKNRAKTEARGFPLPNKGQSRPPLADRHTGGRGGSSRSKVLDA